MVLNQENELDLDIIRKDRRFSCLFRGGAVGIEFWFIGLKTPGTDENFRLLYGLVSSSTHPHQNQWFSSDLRTKLRAQCLASDKKVHYKPRLRKLHVHSDSQTIDSLISALCDGFSLGDSCKQAGVDPPPNEYASFSLSDSRANILKRFALRPAVFCPTRISNRRILRFRQGFTSPFPEVPSFTASVVRLDKLNILCPIPGEEFERPLEILHECVKTLRRETLLDFEGPDASRFGNIEWISSPTKDHRGNSPVQISPIRDMHQENSPAASDERLTFRKIQVGVHSSLFSVVSVSMHEKLKKAV